MRLVTVSFNYPPRLKRPNYMRLLDVFEGSIRQHMPDCEICGLRIDPPNHQGAKKVPFPAHRPAESPGRQEGSVPQ